MNINSQTKDFLMFSNLPEGVLDQTIEYIIKDDLLKARLISKEMYAKASNIFIHSFLPDIEKEQKALSNTIKSLDPFPCAISNCERELEIEKKYAINTKIINIFKNETEIERAQRYKEEFNDLHSLRTRILEIQMFKENNF